MALRHKNPLPLSAYSTPGMIGVGDDGVITEGIGAGLQKVCRLLVPAHYAPHPTPLRACKAAGSVSGTGTPGIPHP